MLFFSALSFLSVASGLLAAQATPLDARGNPSRRAAPSSPRPVSVSRSDSSAGFGFTNAEDAMYSATIYVNGVPYQVQLDTGSADTWIDPLSLGVSPELPPGLIETGINSTDGTVSTGPIVLANVTFGPYTVYNQAVTISYNGTGSTRTLQNGLIGLAGYMKLGDSSIYTLLKNTSYAENGTPLVYNIFEHGPSLPSYTTFLMQRSSGGITDGGIFTVSEVLSNVTDVLNAPRFDSVLPDFWDTYLDGIYVNGKFVSGGSKYENSTEVHVPKGSTIANFDSGTTAIRGPELYAHAVYKDVPGAQLLPGDGGVVGHLYPMHPIDALFFQLDDDSGEFSCVGSISGGPVGDEDWLLGDSFLRNVYILYGYGEPDTNLSSKQPYSQLLSITNADKAWTEFDSMMLQQVLWQEDRHISTLSTGQSATGAPVFTGARPTASLTEASVPAEATLTSSVSSTSVPSSVASGNTDTKIAGAFSENLGALDSSSGKVDLSGLTRNTYIILGLLAAVLVVLFVTVVLMVKGNRANAAYRPVPGGNAVHGKAFSAEGESFISGSYAEGGQ
ncbi:aspartic peptidase domain-containing protein [Cubamyces menziesii]|nr:aspartic peptidase domain-containing protein [Cubamyces menziesii]